MNNRGNRICRYLSVFPAFVLALAANAEVTARVDRADVELNESLKLKIFINSDIDLEPDISVLEQDFSIGQTAHIGNTITADGQVQRRNTWTFVLMPKRAGQIVIPAMQLGGEQTDPLTIVVRESTYKPPGEADIFVTATADSETTYVKAQLLLTIKVYRSVTTRHLHVKNPEFGGVDGFFEIAGEDRTYESVINGTVYSVLERVLAIFPQESGRLTISPAEYEARMWIDGRIAGAKVYRSETLTVEVLPLQPPSPGYPSADWFPARDVQLSEDWSSDATEIRAGVPLTRQITVSALGQIETRIPSIQLPNIDGINLYPTKPNLSRQIESAGIRGIRREQYALIGVTGGEFVLPATELPWWDVRESEWRVAKLPKRTLNILPPIDEPAVGSAAPEAASAGKTIGASKDISPSSLWRRVSELLGALWLATVFAWWWTSRTHRKPREPESKQVHRFVGVSLAP